MTKEQEKARELVLAEWLGELEYQKDHEFDWIEKARIIRMINAIRVLLNIEEIHTVLETMKKEIENL